MPQDQTHGVLPPSFPPPTYWPAIIVIQASAAVQPVPSRALYDGLANTLVSDYDDQVLMIRVVRGRGKPTFNGDENPAQLLLKVPRDDIKATKAISKAVSEYGPKYSSSFLDASELGYPFVDHMVQHLGQTELPEGLFRRLIQLTPLRHGAPEREPEVSGDWRVLLTQLLGPMPAVGPLSKRAVLRKMMKRLKRRMTYSGREPRGDEYPNHDREPEVVRIRVSWPTSGDVSNASISGDLSRWGRAVTNRRVGLALGGSGAWGYAHGALIDRMTLQTADLPEGDSRKVHFEKLIPHLGERKLEDVKVPVDLIAGASSGTLVGAYYATNGNEGIKLMIQNGCRYQYAMIGAMITSTFLEAAVAVDTGFVGLDELECMLFPVTTNLAANEAEFITQSDVPWGVRASCTAPGVFASTIAQDAVYVDGAVSDNVPALLVDWLGADLVIATNPLPPPREIHLKAPKNAFLRFLREFNPLIRAWEIAASSALMFHKVGDYEATQYIIFDPPSAAFPLTSTFMFCNAAEIYENVMKEESFQKTVALTKLAWTELSKPRVVTS